MSLCYDPGADFAYMLCAIYETGSLNLSNLNLKQIPTNCPKVIVNGNFNVVGNKLTDLTNGPQVVSWGYYCDRNPLESLNGAPERVGGLFFSDKFNNVQYLQYCKQRRYRELSLTSSNDEAGLGEILDIL